MRVFLDVACGRYRVVITVRGVHPPFHVVGCGEREERKSALPTAPPEAPGNTQQIGRESRAHGGSGREGENQAGPSHTEN
jgi:hypothetical protein